MLKIAFKTLRIDFASPTLWAPLAAWIGLMILTPIAQWIWGQPGFLLLTNLGVLAHAAASLSILRRSWPSIKLIRVVFTVLPLAWLVEFIGHHTGFPFGDYKYTSLLQPQLAGVPLLIPLAWLMMLPPAWGVAARLASPQRRLLFSALTGLVFTAWDLYLDPQMVTNNLWTWLEPGAYFGIPLVNFFGWWLASSLITSLAAPGDLPQRPLALVYTLTWIFQLVGLGVFWSQPGPALFGFLAMGLFVVPFWVKEKWS